MNDLLDDNNFFILDDESVKISPVSKMPFRKKPRDSMNVHSKSNSNKSLPRTMHLSLDHRFGMFKAYDGNRVLLTNFMEKFLRTVYFGNNDFVVIAGYGDVVIGFMTIKKVYYVDVGKLNLKGDIRVFVGYSKESAAFRIYNKRTRKIHESVNVNFDEILEIASKQFSLKPDLSNLNEREKSSNPSFPTPMVEQATLKLGLVGKPIDHTDYRSMIGSLMYVTLSRPDIMFATCMCARYQANPNEHHVSAVKRIFRYLKGTINLGLWYPKDSGFDLTAYSDVDHTGCQLDQKSTSGSVQFLGDTLLCWSSKKQNCVSISTAESEYIQVAQKKVNIDFENDDSSSRVELIPSKIKYANKVIFNFHKEFSEFSSLSRKENDGLLQDQVFKNKVEVDINVT
nr:uncharacterized mitochondrial protein AtMg00810-like [Tanacetum cinerariifolium]